MPDSRAASNAAQEGGRKFADQEQTAKDCDAIEADLAALRVAYEQFFLGIERKPPTHQYEALKKRLNALRNSFIRQTGIKFRVNSLYSKFLSYERMWQRTIKEMEDGTYHRDVFKARLHAKKMAAAERKAEAAKKKDGAEDASAVEELEEFEEVGPAPAPANAVIAGPGTKAAPGAPANAKGVVAGPGAKPAPPLPSAKAAAAPPPAAKAGVPPAPVGSGATIPDTKLKAIFDAYVKAKKRCNEDTSKLTYDSVATTLRKQVPELLKQHNAKSVDFKVVIKDGKAVLRAVPKE